MSVLVCVSEDAMQVGHHGDVESAQGIAPYPKRWKNQFRFSSD